MGIIRFLNEKILWGAPMLILMLFVGVYLLIVTKGVIFTKFPKVITEPLRTMCRKNKSCTGDGISPFSALSAALGATVGTGNITGVAIAIKTGGPGAIFWMWVAALLGMVIKFCEVTLAVYYREKNPEGGYSGGPMYYIKKGLSSPFLASVFCLFGALSAFGIGNMVQAGSAAGGIYTLFKTRSFITGGVLAVLCGLVLIGGVKRIFKVSEFLVPIMAALYIICCILVLYINKSQLLNSFSLIFRSAFTPTAALGGFSGANGAYAMRIGVSRGLFTNEAGLGSAPIAHSAASCEHPVGQGLWGAFEVFFDTIVMCTLTALVILSSGVWLSHTEGEFLSHMAFSKALPLGGEIVSAGLILFAFASIISWYYYGEKCVEYLFGKKPLPFYKALYVLACFLGCNCDTLLIWELADTLNALMALPNLFALIMLAPKAGELARDFFT